MNRFCCLLGLVLAAGVAHAQVPWNEEPPPEDVDLPILAVAREHPERLWEFLIDPATPYTDAMAAAVRGANLLPLPQVRTLLLARAELWREFSAHFFGFDMPKNWSIPATEIPGVGPGSERRLLGRVWTLPKTRTPYPTTWREACAAPWPWRVQQVLDRCWHGIARRHSTQSMFDVGEETKWRELVATWYAECLRWNTDDEAGAAVFFEATQNPAHAKSLPLLARWRRILLDPRTPATAAQVAGALGEAHRLLLYGEPEARLACQVLLADGLAGPNLQARWHCAYQLGRFLEVRDPKMEKQVQPCPPEALLAAGDYAAAAPPADRIEAWNRLYVFAFSVAEAVANPPFVVDRSLGMDRQDAQALLTKFAAWWTVRRPAVVAEVQARAEIVGRMRQRLVDLDR